jgi:hypothetical protein
MMSRSLPPLTIASVIAGSVIVVGKPVFSLTDNLKAKKVEPLEMVRIGERFFTSLGFEPLPKTFWERSLFMKPRDREVVCHASAWDIDSVNDVRIKMCIDVNAEDFTTIHHELGHNFYQRAYSTSWRRSSSSSSIARSRKPRAARRRSIAARSTAARRPAPG